MEANKGHNLLVHEDEIASRPKKTWFMSEKEKKRVRELSKKLANGEEETEEAKGKQKAPRKPKRPGKAKPAETAEERKLRQTADYQVRQAKRLTQMKRNGQISNAAYKRAVDERQPPRKKAKREPVADAAAASRKTPGKKFKSQAKYKRRK